MYRKSWSLNHRRVLYFFLWGAATADATGMAAFLLPRLVCTRTPRSTRRTIFSVRLVFLGSVSGTLPPGGAREKTGPGRFARKAADAAAVSKRERCRIRIPGDAVARTGRRREERKRNRPIAERNPFSERSHRRPKKKKSNVGATRRASKAFCWRQDDRERSPDVSLSLIARRNGSTSAGCGVSRKIESYR